MTRTWESFGVVEHMNFLDNLVRTYARTRHRMGKSALWHIWILEQFDKRRKRITCEVNRSDDICVRCGFCCHMAPGVLSREDIDNIAGYLNITPQEMVEKYLTLRVNGPDGKLRPMCIREGGKAGGYLPSRATWIMMPCTFYEDRDDGGFCRIHPVKPFQCARQAPHGARAAWPEPIPREDLEKLGFQSFGD